MLTWHLFTNDQTVLFEQNEQTVLLQTQCLISEPVDKSRDGVRDTQHPRYIHQESKGSRNTLFKCSLREGSECDLLMLAKGQHLNSCYEARVLSEKQHLSCTLCSHNEPKERHFWGHKYRVQHTNYAQFCVKTVYQLCKLILRRNFALSLCL